MKEIDKEEMFSNLKGFLKSKGIELQEGSYSHGIRKGCDLLTDTVNMSQRAFDHAKDAVDKGFDHVRQTIHEKTAPKPPVATAAAPEPAGETEASASAKPNGTKSSSAKTTRASAKKSSPKFGKKHSK
jgi:hypothetical protein